MRTIVYEYGLRQPIEGEQLVNEQLALGHKYYNNLVELERRRREEVEKNFGIDEAIEEINSDYSMKKRVERANCGLYWGNYQIIEQAFRQALRTRPKNGQAWTDLPYFRRWNGHGAVAVQIQGGWKTEKIFKPNTLAMIEPMDARAYSNEFPRHFRRKCQYTTFKMRVGSDIYRKPVWATWPVWMHRELPSDGIIKWVKVIRIPWFQVWDYRWKLQITMKVPDIIPKSGNSIVAINFGWRQTDPDMRTMRVATWADSYGDSGELVLDWNFRGRIEKAEKLQGLRDKLMNELREQLIEEGIDCAEWRSQKRFHRLATSDDLDSVLSDLLDEWHGRDEHLWWYQRGVRNGAINYRRDIYRCFAKKIAQKYDVILVDDMDLRRIIRSSKKNEASAQRVEAAPSILRSALNCASARSGARIEQIKAKNLTKTCHKCGHVDEWNQAVSVIHECSCGEEWDQDVNCCLNMINTWRKK